MKNQLFVGLILAALAGCHSSQTPGTSPRAAGDSVGDRPIAAIATVGMVADLVRNVGTDRVVVTQIMGAGVDPLVFPSHQRRRPSRHATDRAAREAEEVFLLRLQRIKRPGTVR